MSATISGYSPVGAAELCWDVRVKRHVPCGWNPPGWGAGTSRPSTPSGPAQEEIERQREAEQFEREETERRRKEEERRARQNTERERRRRQEEARKRQEFLKKKSEALDSLKGIDYDGSKVTTGKDSDVPKSGTATFGVQPNPDGQLGLKSLPPAQPPPAEKEPLFSTGTKFSAPVDLTHKDPAHPFAVDPKKVAGLVPDGDVGAFIRRQNWPVKAKAETVLGLLLWERGRHEEAARLLGMANASVPNNPFLQEALAKVNRARQVSRRERPAKNQHREAAASMVAAAERWTLGDTATALRLVRRAEKLWPDNPEIRKSLRRVEQVHASRTDIPPPQEREARMRRASRWASGQAAFKLGLIFAAQSDLNQKQDYRDWAQYYLGEAGLLLEGPDRELVDQLRRSVADKKVLHNPIAVANNRQSFYPSKADAMLDALEYGNGNWEASFKYLQHVQQAFPFDSTIALALEELSVIRKTAEK